MPDGITHQIYRRKARVIAFPFAFLFPFILIPLEFRVHGEWIIGLGIVLGYEMGLFVTPDWDIMSVTKDEGEMVNRIPIFGHILFGISSAYGSAFRRWHRSNATHLPFFSTAIRFTYLFWWIWYEIYRSNLDLAWLIFLFIGLYIGNSLADWVHYYLDMVKFPKSK